MLIDMEPINLAATVVTYTVNPENAEALRAGVEQHIVPAARSAAGYRGFLLVDQAEGKRAAVLLYDSVDHARAAQQVIGPVARDNVHKLMASPSVTVTGTAIVADGAFAKA
jgi:hypothetical protein